MNKMLDNQVEFDYAAFELRIMAQLAEESCQPKCQTAMSNNYNQVYGVTGRMTLVVPDVQKLILIEHR